MMTTRSVDRHHEIIMSETSNDDKEILPASGEDEPVFGVHILELKFTSCRYVVRYSDDSEAFFCGEVIHRVSYCQTHYRICYISNNSRA